MSPHFDRFLRNSSSRAFVILYCKRIYAACAADPKTHARRHICHMHSGNSPVTSSVQQSYQGLDTPCQFKAVMECAELWVWICTAFYCYRVLLLGPLRHLMLESAAQAARLPLAAVQTNLHTMWWQGQWHVQPVSLRYTHLIQ